MVGYRRKGRGTEGDTRRRFGAGVTSRLSRCTLVPFFPRAAFCRCSWYRRLSSARAGERDGGRDEESRNPLSREGEKESETLTRLASARLQKRIPRERLRDALRPSYVSKLKS